MPTFADLVTDLREISPCELDISEVPDPDAARARVEDLAREIRVEEFFYQAATGRTRGFLVQPREAREKLPALIFCRGGSMDFGKITPRQLFFWVGKLAQAGYAVFATQYPGVDGGDGQDEFGGADLDSVLALRELIAAHPGADETRIGMYGISRGGMMVYEALACADWIRAAVVIAGPTDIAREEIRRPETAVRNRKMFDADAPGELERRSVLRWPERLPKNAPILIMHGTADWRVDPRDSLDLAAQLVAHRIPHRLVMFEGASHDLLEVRREHFRMTEEWLRRFVRDGEALPDMEPHGE